MCSRLRGASNRSRYSRGYRGSKLRIHQVIPSPDMQKLMRQNCLQFLVRKGLGQVTRQAEHRTEDARDGNGLVASKKTHQPHLATDTEPPRDFAEQGKGAPLGHGRSHAGRNPGCLVLTQPETGAPAPELTWEF
jgi:hypothetical protein